MVGIVGPEEERAVECQGLLFGMLVDGFGIAIKGRDRGRGSTWNYHGVDRLIVIESHVRTLRLFSRITAECRKKSRVRLRASESYSPCPHC